MHRPDLESADPDWTRREQLRRFNILLPRLQAENRFYATKTADARAPLAWDDFTRLPFTTKAELVADQAEHPPFGRNLTAPVDRYVAFHQTSGTAGVPLIILDTVDGWSWWSECWQYVYAAAGVGRGSRLFFAFSFGPFIGFWSAHAAARRIGALVVPGGGMDSRQRLDLIRRSRADVLLCTPTYALRLAEVAAQEGVGLRALDVRTTIHAGEPGASIPEVRERIETAWGARAFDHAGATEVGAYGFTCEQQSALHLNEAEFIVETIVPGGSRAALEGEVAELVMTNLGRADWPVVRYRTGDLVRVSGRRCACGRTFLAAPGGLIGRADDLIVLRGVNVHPSAVEAVLRGFDVSEFRLVRLRAGALEDLTVEVEAAPGVETRVAEALRTRLNVRIRTVLVPAGSLPRFEMKARRVVDHR